MAGDYQFNVAIKLNLDESEINKLEQRLKETFTVNIGINADSLAPFEKQMSNLVKQAEQINKLLNGAGKDTKLPNIPHNNNNNNRTRYDKQTRDLFNLMDKTERRISKGGNQKYFDYIDRELRNFKGTYPSTASRYKDMLGDSAPMSSGGGGYARPTFVPSRNPYDTSSGGGSGSGGGAWSSNRRFTTNAGYYGSFYRKAGTQLSQIGEKFGNFSDSLMGIGSILGAVELKTAIIDVPARAETNKYMLGLMGDAETSADKLYKTVDKTTDQLPISMQNVIQPLNAFKSATGASASEINDIIPEFANFGAIVQNLTGSSDLAETAMQKLSYGIQGSYAALDQYGITEESLKNTGKWDGDETDVRGFMAAVTEVVGDAKGTMGTFNGMVMSVSKQVQKAGKEIFEFIEPFMKTVMGTFSTLNDASGGWIAKLGLATGGLATLGTSALATAGYISQIVGAWGGLVDAMSVLKDLRPGTLKSILKRDTGNDYLQKEFDAELIGKNGKYYGGNTVLKDRIRQDWRASPFNYDPRYNYRERNNTKKDPTNKEKQAFNWFYTSRDQATPFRKREQMDLLTSVPFFDREDIADNKDKKKSVLDLFKESMKENATEDEKIQGEYVLEQYKKQMKESKPGNKTPVSPGTAREKQRELANMGKLDKLRFLWKGASDVKSNAKANGKGELSASVTAMGKFNGALTSLISPLSLLSAAFFAVQAGIMVLIAGFSLAYNTSQQFRDTIQNIINNVGALFTEIGAGIGDILNAFGLTNNGGLDGLIELVQGIADSILSIVQHLRTLVQEATGRDAYADEQYNKYEEQARKDTEILSDPDLDKNSEKYRQTAEHLSQTRAKQYEFVTPAYDANGAPQQVSFTNPYTGKTLEDYGISTKRQGEYFLIEAEELNAAGRGSTLPERPDAKSISSAYAKYDEEKNIRTSDLNVADYLWASALPFGLSDLLGTNKVRAARDNEKYSGYASLNEAARTEMNNPKTWGERNNVSYIDSSNMTYGRQNGYVDTSQVTPGLRQQAQQMPTMDLLSGFLSQIPLLGLNTVSAADTGTGTDSGSGDPNKRIPVDELDNIQADNVTIQATNTDIGDTEPNPNGNVNPNAVSTQTQTATADAGGGVDPVAYNQQAWSQINADATAGIAQLQTQITTDIQTALSSISTEIAPIGQSIGQGLTTGITDGMSTFGESINSKVAEAVNSISSHSSEASSAGNKIGKSASNGFDTGLDLAGIAQTEATNVLNALDISDEAYAKGYAAGEAYATGFKESQQINSPGISALAARDEAAYIVGFMSDAIPRIGRTAYSMGRGLADNYVEAQSRYWSNPVVGVDGSDSVGLLGGSKQYKSMTDSLEGIGRVDLPRVESRGGETVINNTFNIDKVDSEDRVREIAETVVRLATWNNETAGRSTPDPSEVS